MGKDQYIIQSRRRRAGKGLMAVLTCIVGFVTVHMLILPAVTMEYSCGLEAHTHTQECYEEENLSCEILEHVHTEQCEPVSDEPTEISSEPPSEPVAEETAAETGVPETEEWTEVVALLSETEPEATEPPANAAASDSDVSVVTGQGIRFRLFNYSVDINKAAGNQSWRAISSYFTFRNSQLTVGSDPQTCHIPDPNMNTAHDADGFTVHHATVERVLNGTSPVLDLTRDADGTARTDPGVSADVRSLAYLFSDTGDHAVTAYSPGNTILQKSGTHYWYRSNSNAVDYDAQANLFRVRNYTERNSTTAGYGNTYGDFLPFTYTDGTEIGTSSSGVAYHVLNSDTDYWFGMTMEVSFFQTKDGILGGEDMVFSFSGDDDVWVFVDDVLVLDLGGTHGTVDGSINFATGQILQYLSWNGANTSQTDRTDGSATSFPTTIRACFDAAGRTPNGGWSSDGQTFASYTEHTLKFFYLERGAAVANCILDFALPTLPDKSLTVTKDLVADGGAVKEFIEESLSYRFRVVKSDENGNGTGELFIQPGTSFDLLENGVKVSTGTVDTEGYFYLKAGQSAQFTEMLKKGAGATQYIVEEILPDGLTGQYAGVEYEVSGSGGETKTEEGPTAEFSAYQTASLSAEDTQTVTFRNRVDLAQLGTLEITKRQAEGASFADGQHFSIQVKLGDVLLPVGTVYIVGEETREVEQAGILSLGIDETAVISGILSGTAYEIAEQGTEDGGYNAAYSGTVTPKGTVICSADGAYGEFPLAGTVRVTVTNANYDFALRIPISKQTIDQTSSASFRFLVEQVEPENWTVLESLPGTQITVTDESAVSGSIVIGYTAGTEGIFYYRIREQHGSGNYIYDDTFYILEVTVTEGAAAVSQILKNGSEEFTGTLTFVNRRTTSLIVTKTVVGAVGSMEFPFTVTVMLDGEPFILPQSGSNQMSFALAHGEAISIPNIPIGADVTVTETSHDGFIASCQIVGQDEAPVPGDYMELNAGNSVKTVNFINESGFRIPDTGGMGIKMYTVGGLILKAISLILLLYNHTRKRREEDAPEGA